MRKSSIPALLTAMSVVCLATGCDGGSDDAASTATAATADDTGTVLLYVADRYEGVFELDPDTLEIIGLIDTGPRPHGLVASPDGALLYITVETTNELLKVDVATNEIIARTEISPVPNEPTITRDGRFVYAPSRAGDQCDIVDTETM